MFLLVSYSVFSQTTIYSEDFNSNAGSWNLPNSTTNGTKNWQQGSISLHSSGASGEYIYSDSPGNSNKYKKDSYILATSPVISTVGHSNLTFEMDVWYNTGNQGNDGMQVQYSFNGSSWSVLGNPDSSTNWYNDWWLGIGGGGWSSNSNGWVTKSINLSALNTGFDNNSHVQFRVVFTSTNYATPPNNSGVAFDNIKITKPAPVYCTPTNINTGYSGWNLYISNVAFGTFNNPTTGTRGSFNNYTSQTPLNISTGSTLSGLVSLVVNGWNNTSYDLNVWIDLNQDYDFDDAGEKVSIKVNDYLGASVINVPINFPIPTNASEGNTRMRFSVSSGTVTSCAFNWETGEVEDYTINITGCSLNTWTGITSDNWNTASNWSCGSVPSLSSNVLIPSPLASGNFPIIYNGAAFGKANNIEFQTGATLKVVNNYIQIAGTLVLNGSIDLQGESQLIQNTGSTLNDASTGFIEIDQQGQGNKYRYNDWASPVIKTNTSNGNTYKVSEVLRDGTDPSNPKTINFIGGFDGSNATSPISIANYWIYKYVNKPDGSYNGWDQIGSNGSLKPGEGFLMKGTGAPGSPDQNYVFTGKPNNGTIQLPIGPGNNYLIGNPYPSAIDLDKFIDDNTPTGTGSSITGTIYFWEHYGGNSHNLAQYQAGYATYTKGGGVPATAGALVGVSSSGTPAKTPQRYLAVAQGFFVVGDDTAGGTIEFNNSQRVFVTESSGNSIFMKSENAKYSKNSNSVDARQKFRIGFDSKNIDHRQILLTLDNKTTDGIDWGYDAELYEEFKDDMYWLTNNKKLVIQAVSDVNSTKQYLVGIKVNEKGTVKIKLDEIENEDPNLEVFLKDSLLGITYNLKEGNFEKELDPGTYNNRFYIVFNSLKDYSENSKVDKFEAIDLDINYDGLKFNIKKAEDLKISRALLFNSLGQLIKTWNIINDQAIGIRLDVSAGVYFLKIETDKGIVNKKVLIK